MANFYGLVALVGLFINCILSIDLYRNSHCNTDKECPSYLTVDVKEDGKLDVGSGCDKLGKIHESNPILGEFIISVLIFFALLFIGVVCFFTDELNILVIVVIIVNTIVSFMNMAVYDKCTKTANCVIASSHMTDDKSYKKTGNVYRTKCVSQNPFSTSKNLVIFTSVMLSLTILVGFPLWYFSMD